MWGNPRRISKAAVVASLIVCYTLASLPLKPLYTDTLKMMNLINYCIL
jgi:hypothetical protein